MSAIFIKYKTSNRHRILLNLTDKINLKRRNKYVALLNLSLYYSVKYANNKLKISCPTQNEKINYLMGLILYQMFQAISSI